MSPINTWRRFRTVFYNARQIHRASLVNVHFRPSQKRCYRLCNNRKSIQFTYSTLKNQYNQIKIQSIYTPSASLQWRSTELKLL